jgi:hypothetical protein
MKLTRQYPTQRRARFHIGALLRFWPVWLALLVLVMLVAGWVKGGAEPLQVIEQPVPAERLAR